MNWNDHNHRGEYADERHDHYDYAERHHWHYDLENDDEKAQRRITGLQDEVDALRGRLDDALGRIAALEDTNTRLVAALREAAAGEESVCRAGVASDERLAVAEALDEAFAAFATALDEGHVDEDALVGDSDRANEPADICPETSDGYHCNHWQEGVSRCCACGSKPDEDLADEDEPEEYDPGPECDDEGGMSEYRYLLPEDYERGQS